MFLLAFAYTSIVSGLYRKDKNSLQWDGISWSCTRFFNLYLFMLILTTMQIYNINNWRILAEQVAYTLDVLSSVIMPQLTNSYYNRTANCYQPMDTNLLLISKSESEWLMPLWLKWLLTWIKWSYYRSQMTLLVKGII